jgi:hypothetical protein
MVGTSTCIHGFPSDGCLICQTLQHEPASSKSNAPGRRPKRAPAVRPDAVIAPAPKTHAHLPLSLRVGGALALVAVAGLMLIWVIGIIYAALRLVELAATAMVAGYTGWKLGVHHGRHEAGRRPPG